MLLKRRHGAHRRGRDPQATGWMRRWAAAWRATLNGRGEEDDQLSISYVGQVHTLGKLCEARHNEEDGGRDGTKLVNQLRLLLVQVRGETVAWTSEVVADTPLLAQVASAGSTCLAAATNFAEEFFIDLIGSSYRRGGANCIAPESQAVRGRWAQRLNAAAEQLILTIPSSWDAAWRPSPESVLATAAVWGLPASALLADEHDILAHIAGNYVGRMPTAGELRRDLFQLRRIRRRARTTDRFGTRVDRAARPFFRFFFMRPQ